MTEDIGTYFALFILLLAIFLFVLLLIKAWIWSRDRGFEPEHKKWFEDCVKVMSNEEYEHGWVERVSLSHIIAVLFGIEIAEYVKDPLCMLGISLFLGFAFAALSGASRGRYCPECGAPLTKKLSSRFECSNICCDVVEVRFSRQGKARVKRASAQEET